MRVRRAPAPPRHPLPADPTQTWGSFLSSSDRQSIALLNTSSTIFFSSSRRENPKARQSLREADAGPHFQRRRTGVGEELVFVTVGGKVTR